MSGEAKETVNHPHHYNAHESGVECIDLIEDMPFNLGNAIKYLWRRDHKESCVEDLKKSRWYLLREVERLERADFRQVQITYQFAMTRIDQPFQKFFRFERAGILLSTFTRLRDAFEAYEPHEAIYEIRNAISFVDQEIIRSGGSL